MKRAFTLIELLVIIAIIGILSAIVIPIAHTFVDGANNAIDSDEYRLYLAWRSANHYPLTTFEEWRLLRANNMLPATIVTQ